MFPLRALLRSTAPKLPSSGALRPSMKPKSVHAPVLTRAFHVQPAVYKGITPSSADPPAPNPSSSSTTHTSSSPAKATSLTANEYHKLADGFLESLLNKLEVLQEEREDVDVEYTAGVLTLTLPPAGTYVLNKQPPNRQIWLSSPLSGPKRYDWVVKGEGMHQKEGCGVGEWVYLRDGSTLTGLVRREMGVTVEEGGEVDGGGH